MKKTNKQKKKQGKKKENIQVNIKKIKITQ